MTRRKHVDFIRRVAIFVHDPRHEAVSRPFERGLNIAEVSAISGHREMKMLQRYVHLRAVDLVARLD